MDGISELRIAYRSQCKLLFLLFFFLMLFLGNRRPGKGWGSRVVGGAGLGGWGGSLWYKKKLKKKTKQNNVLIIVDMILSWKKLYCDFEECWNLFKGIMR